MKLPKHLASRYSKMSPEEMEGSGQAKDLVQAAMLKGGGKPGPIKIDDTKITKAILRPGVIDWDPSKDAGVWFDLRKAGVKGIPSASHLDLSKILHSRYVKQDVKQGHDVREFPEKGPPTPVQKEEAKMVAKVKAAAKVEADATELAEKAKATKEAALSGLHYMGLGYLGDEAAVQAATAAMVEAQQAAFAPTCTTTSGSGFPAFVCDPSLMERFVGSQSALAAVAEAHNNEAAAAAAKSAAVTATATAREHGVTPPPALVAAAGGGTNKMMLIAIIAATVVIGILAFKLGKKS